MPEENEVKEQGAAAEGGDGTPIDEGSRKTGSGAATNAKPTAVQESGSSDPLTEGGGNQGTEKR
jgi:photosystem I subunit 4